MPHVDEGIWLGRHTEVHAMMDLSDGLASDLGHILDLSHAAARIDCEAIPHPDATLEEAVCGGEDYCLLLTAAAEGFETLSRDFESHFAKPLYPIGRITDTPSAGSPGSSTARAYSTTGTDSTTSECRPETIPQPDGTAALQSRPHSNWEGGGGRKEGKKTPRNKNTLCRQVSTQEKSPKQKNATKKNFFSVLSIFYLINNAVTEKYTIFV